MTVITVGEPLLMTPTQAGAMVGKSRTWVYAALGRGAFPSEADPITPIRVGQSQRISRAALVSWIARQEATP